MLADAQQGFHFLYALPIAVAIVLAAFWLSDKLLAKAAGRSSLLRRLGRWLERGTDDDVLRQARKRGYRP